MRTPAPAIMAALAYSYLFVNFDTPEVHFADYGQFLEAGYDRTNWLPKDMPRTATNIREIHSFETGNVLAQFDLSTDELQRYRANLVAAIIAGAGACEADSLLHKASTFWQKERPGELIQISATEQFTVGETTVYYNTCK